MKNYPLLAYFVLLTLLSGSIIAGMVSLGTQGIMLVQVYMLAPAIAALLTRAFFYAPKFSDACLRFGRWKDYLKFWMAGISITALSYLLFTIFGSISWDLSGQTFLDNLTTQLAFSGQNINDTMPPGLTPQMMLWLFFFGGLTVFNILPGLIIGFGEEFGHRGFMFPMLFKINPWLGLVGGGLLWYAWHLPLGLITPAVAQTSVGEQLLNHFILAVGSVCTFIYLAYVYVKSRSVFVTALAHIVLNNSASSFSYFVTVQNQLLANLGLSLTMAIVVVILYLRKEFVIFQGNLSV